MDFGLALTRKSHRVTYSNLTATMGTPDYMAPEQVEGQRGDQRTDEYALGTILFELLAGHPPFTGDSNLAVMAQHVNKSAPRLDHVQPCVSAGLAAAVSRSLQREPDRRYPDLNEFIAAINHPETVDTSILVETRDPGRIQLLLASTPFRAVAISVALIAIITVFAFLLQSIH
jgi:serine/threonine-protein kinase